MKKNNKNEGKLLVIDIIFTLFFWVSIPYILVAVLGLFLGKTNNYNFIIYILFYLIILRTGYREDKSI